MWNDEDNNPYGSFDQQDHTNDPALSAARTFISSHSNSTFNDCF